MTKNIINLKVFVSSPNDVEDERALVIDAVERLQYNPVFRDKVFLKTISWDRPVSSSPMIVTINPQEAINMGMPKPSECDIVIIILWSRMGTPLSKTLTKDNGEVFLSGTEWEFYDALNAYYNKKRPTILVYKKNEGVMLDIADPFIEDKIKQWERVEKFIGDIIEKEGAIQGGINQFSSSDEFKNKIDSHLTNVVFSFIKKKNAQGDTPKINVPQKVKNNIPYIGLRAFGFHDKNIFFGRGRDTDSLIKKFRSESNFIAVVGASGSGKSSLVSAGLLPRLKNNAISGSKDWEVIRFTPGDVGLNPFVPFVIAIKTIINDEMLNERTLDITRKIENDIEYVGKIFNQLLYKKPSWTKIVIFIDQFEELFSICDPGKIDNFIELMSFLLGLNNILIIITLRADFFHKCLSWNKLAFWLREGTFPLSIPERESLLEMIAKPAELCGLTLESDLIWKILNDTGTEPGSLALMAYTLEQLHEKSKNSDSKVILLKDYYSIGGVQGAVGRRAQEIFSLLSFEARSSLPSVFKELVEVSEEGIGTRQRTKESIVSNTKAKKELVDEFTKGRLLVKSKNDKNEAIVEVAHETLFRNWPKLKDWINDTQDELRLLKQIKLSSVEWLREDKDPKHLWPHERLIKVYKMLDNLEVELDEVTNEFIKPEFERLIEELNLEIPHERRSYIGDRLNEIKDSRYGINLTDKNIPDINWIEIPSGDIYFNGDNRYVSPFFISKFCITYAQYKAFLEDTNGFTNDKWWRGLYKQEYTPGEQNRKFDNHPVERVSWYDAISFCRWLSDRTGLNINLPTEFEWMRAFNAGKKESIYPWGGETDSSKANTSLSGLSRTVAVGMYPNGSSPYGVMDMVGQVFEWCLNEYEPPYSTSTSNDSHRTMKGGSWYFNDEFSTVDFRTDYYPALRNVDVGFRIIHRP